MHRVIVKHYRENHWPNSGGRRANIPLEDLRTREGMKAHHSHRKHFWSNLSPLRNWLQSQVGRHWDDVFSEVCQVINPGNPIRSHLLKMVRRNTFIRCGKVWCFRETSCGQTEELAIGRACTRQNPFFVHPESRVLWKAGGYREDYPGAGWAKAERAERSRSIRWISDNTLLRKVAGGWYRCEMREWGRDRRRLTFDVSEKSEITSGKAWDIYEKAVYCVAKRQLASKELAKHRLKNN